MLTEDMLPPIGETLSVYVAGHIVNHTAWTFTGRLVEKMYRPTLTGSSILTGVKIRRPVSPTGMEVVTLVADHIVAISTTQKDDRP
jgi:hypothetical protein